MIDPFEPTPKLDDHADPLQQHRLHQDLHATLGAQQELGARYQPELVDSFLRRLDQTLDARIEQQVKGRKTHRGIARGQGWSRGGMLLAAVALGIPLSAFSLCFGAFSGIFLGLGFHSVIAGLVFGVLVAGGSFAALAMVLAVLGLMYFDRRRTH